MENKETIRDFYGRILGYVITDDKGNKTVRNFYGKVLGYYDKVNNVTRDFYQRVIGRGDQAVSLIYRENNK